MHRRAMNRRQALRALALGSVGAASVPAWVATLGDVASAHTGQPAATTGAGVPWTPAVFDPHQHETVVTLAELIIPKTDTAGATDANVAQFIDTILEDAPDAERDRFLDGLAWLDARSQELFGADFQTASDTRQAALLTILSSPENQSTSERTGVEFFMAMKDLTVTGYYTSEIGMLEELDDDGIRFYEDDVGCVHPEHQRD